MWLKINGASKCTMGTPASSHTTSRSCLLVYPPCLGSSYPPRTCLSHCRIWTVLPPPAAPRPHHLCSALTASLRAHAACTRPHAARMGQVVRSHSSVFGGPPDDERWVPHLPLESLDLYTHTHSQWEPFNLHACLPLLGCLQFPTTGVPPLPPHRSCNVNDNQISGIINMAKIGINIINHQRKKKSASASSIGDISKHQIIIIKYNNNGGNNNNVARHI